MRKIIVLCLLGLLSACATPLKGPKEAVDLPAQLRVLAKLDQWKINGRLALKQPERSISATMRWQTNQDDFSLRLTNFIGVTLVDLTSANGEVVLEADDQTYRDTDPDRLLTDVTGWNIPLSALQRWLKGVPTARDQYTLTEQGLLKRLLPRCQDCAGWQIDYNGYMQVGELWLPQQIVLHNVFDPNQWIKIRISEWQLQQ